MPTQLTVGEFLKTIRSADFKQFDKRMRKGNILTRVNNYQIEQMKRRGYEETKLIANDTDRINKEIMTLEAAQERHEETMLRTGQLKPLKCF